MSEISSLYDVSYCPMLQWCNILGLNSVNQVIIATIAKYVVSQQACQYTGHVYGRTESHPIWNYYCCRLI